MSKNYKIHYMPIFKHQLRIGSHISGATILELFREHALVQLFNGTQAGMSYRDMNPIPLTIAYLQIAGFEPLLEGWHKPGLYILQEHTGFYLPQASGQISKSPINSVHQLENLYQALTGHLLPSNIDERDDSVQNN
jgi:hypothetical protein